MQDYFDIKIPSNPKLMRLVRRAVASACELMGFDPREVNAITLAVDEGCTNIIRHCHGGRYCGVIEIRLRMGRDRLVVMIRDFGVAIDLARLEDCLARCKRELDSPGPVQPGGLGVMLIHSVMDKVRYKTNPRSGTVLRLVKYLPGKKGDKVGS
jgi:serine/threonine-protein kinase RsbW